MGKLTKKIPPGKRGIQQQKRKSSSFSGTKQQNPNTTDKPETSPRSGSVDFSFDDIGGDLGIVKVETSKDKIRQPKLAADERMIIPRIGSSVIISGKSGSGKSTLLQNLIVDHRFYGKCDEKKDGWFDKIFLFSPTAGTDDVLRQLHIPKNHVFTDLEEAPALLKIIQESQKAKLDGGNKADQVIQIAVIFEDVIGETEFMNSREFMKMFYMVRHINCTTFICTQHFNRVPKVCRLQAGTIYFFAGSAAEVEVIVEDFAPPMYTKKEIIHMVNEATKGEHSFLTICMKVGWKYRFRRNLNEFINLPRIVEQEDENAKGKHVDEKKKECEKTKDNEHEQKKGDFYDSSKKVREDIAKIVAFKKYKHAVDEQARKVVGQWAHESARGRIVF